MKKLITTGAIIVCSLISFNSVAQMSEEDAESAIKRRQAVFQLLSFSNGPLGQMARGAEFDQAAAIEGSERLIMLADMIPELFAAADTRGTSAATRSSDSIWDSQTDFAQLSQDLADGAAAAIEILNTQGADGVRQAIGQIGPKCGACHDRFRLD